MFREMEYFERGKKTAEDIVSKLEEKAEEIFDSKGMDAQKFYIFGINQILDIKKKGILKLSKKEKKAIEKLYNETLKKDNDKYKEFDKEIYAGKEDAYEACEYLSNQESEISDFENGKTNDFIAGATKIIRK